jgi:hypothetical protein
MTLKEKFKNILFIYEIATEKAKIDRCEQVADDFAIGFAKWLINDWHNDERWSIITDRKQLLEIYKKENEL